MPKTDADTAPDPRPLIAEDVETEVVPPTGVPVEDTAQDPGDGFVDRILADHADWVAVTDCDWLGQLAYRAGAKVSSTHPGLPQWVEGEMVKPATSLA